MEKKRKFILIIAVVGMIGTFLPWASAFGFTLSGTDDGGWLTLILFAIGGAIAFFYGDKQEALQKKIMTGVWIPAAIAVIVALLKILRSRPAGVNNGFGLWLVFLAGLAQVFVTFFFKGEGGWDLPKSVADVKKAANIPSVGKQETAPAAPAAPAAPVEPAPKVEAAPKAPPAEGKEDKE